jgi:hypothetical protein
MYKRLPVKYTILLLDSNETLIFSADFKEILIKFHENPSSGNRVAACGQAGMTKMVVAFCNFANCLKLNISSINELK